MAGGPCPPTRGQRDFFFFFLQNQHGPRCPALEGLRTAGPEAAGGLEAGRPERAEAGSPACGQPLEAGAGAGGRGGINNGNMRPGTRRHSPEDRGGRLVRPPVTRKLGVASPPWGGRASAGQVAVALRLGRAQHAVNLRRAVVRSARGRQGCGSRLLLSRGPRTLPAGGSGAAADAPAPRPGLEPRGPGCCPCPGGPWPETAAGGHLALPRRPPGSAGQPVLSRAQRWRAGSRHFHTRGSRGPRRAAGEGAAREHKGPRARAPRTGGQGCPWGPRCSALSAPPAGGHRPGLSCSGPSCPPPAPACSAAAAGAPARPSPAPPGSRPCTW